MPNRHIVAGAPSCGWVPLLDPTGNTFIEDPEIAVTLGKELFVGQTGQLVWARSVEDD